MKASAAMLLACLALAATATAAAPATKRPGQLTVALSLPAPALQVGAVRGSEIVLARGFEVDVARALARRLRLRVRLVQVGDDRRFLRPGTTAWDVALAQLVPTPVRTRSVSFTSPYLRDDPVVLVRRGLPRPGSLAELRRLQLCAERGRRAADTVAARVRPRARPLLVRDLDTLLRRVQTGACDAALAELSRLGPALEGRRDLFGGLAGRIETERVYAIALERGSPLLAAVDGAVRALRADGTLRRLTSAGLGIDPATLRVLR
jgi:polar amino acid transport system substrate-binding protein